LAEQSGFEAVRDQLDTALTSLSQLIDIGVLTRTDGGVDVSVGNGHALVIGSNKYAIGVSPRPATGLSDLVTAGGHVMTAQVTGGSVGGMLQVRDRLLPGYMTQLDQLAFDVAGSVNTAHRAGFDLAGTAGGDFFAPPAAVAGAARTLSVTAALVANSNLIAAAGTPAPGDNQNARAITNLQQAALGSGTTNPVDTWASLVYRVGSDAQGAKSELGGHAEVVRQLQTLRDQVSAVSLDEEAANLTKFQMAYQANARYFSVIQTSLDQLMQMGGF
jgi:flagellar hook-associated protein 1 FlgK